MRVPRKPYHQAVIELLKLEAELFVRLEEYREFHAQRICAYCELMGQVHVPPDQVPQFVASLRYIHRFLLPLSNARINGWMSEAIKSFDADSGSSSEVFDDRS